MRIISHRLFPFAVLIVLLLLFVPLLANTPDVFLRMGGDDRIWFVGFVALCAAAGGCFGIDLGRALCEGLFRE